MDVRKKNLLDLREALKVLSVELAKMNKDKDAKDALKLSTIGTDDEVEKHYDRFVTLAYDL